MNRRAVVWIAVMMPCFGCGGLSVDQRTNPCEYPDKGETHDLCQAQRLREQQDAQRPRYQPDYAQLPRYSQPSDQQMSDQERGEGASPSTDDPSPAQGALSAASAAADVFRRKMECAQRCTNDGIACMGGCPGFNGCNGHPGCMQCRETCEMQANNCKMGCN